MGVLAPLALCKSSCRLTTQGAPSNIFRGAMNATLQPLLHKCVLVFYDDILVYCTAKLSRSIHSLAITRKERNNRRCINHYKKETKRSEIPANV